MVKPYHNGDTLQPHNGDSLQPHICETLQSHICETLQPHNGETINHTLVTGYNSIAGSYLC